MSFAYVDTSYLAAIALDEKSAGALAKRFKAFDRLVASPLLEAELRSAFARDNGELDETLLESIVWVYPDRSLGPEIRRVLTAGYIRGADCFHLASALYFMDEPRANTFLTLDARQRTVAKALGFKT
jgi:hypothetical protein